MNYIKCACCTLFSLLFTLTVSSGCKEKDMSMKMNEPRNIKGVISYKRSFGDLNDTHLSAAKRIGIRPLASRTEAEGLGGKLVEVAPCERYAMDSLTHSIPFLVPKAGALLDTIGVKLSLLLYFVLPMMSSVCVAVMEMLPQTLPMHSELHLM